MVFDACLFSLNGSILRSVAEREIDWAEIEADDPPVSVSAADTTAAITSQLPDDAVQQTEYALWRRSIGGQTWVEALDRNGLPVRLLREQPPDVAAAKLFLAAKLPTEYGEHAELTITQRYVVELPRMADSTEAWLASLPIAGRGGTPGIGGPPDRNASSVPSPSDFSKKTALTRDD